MKTVNVGNIKIGGNQPLALLAGPCVLEGFERSLKIGKAIKEITQRLGIPYVFKASFDKANRSSYSSFRGPGITEGVKILQIPAFLSRQTDLLYQAAKTGKTVNVKKGQFLSPAEMKNAVVKMEEAGNENLMLTERGASFGYNNLVVDMRSFPIMRSFGYPVVFDATHSVQLPGGAGTASAGQREYVEYLTRGAVAVGVDALFMEIHDNPPEALCDGANMLYVDQLEDLLKDVLAIDAIVKKRK